MKYLWGSLIIFFLACVAIAIYGISVRHSEPEITVETDKDTTNKPAFYLGEGMILVMTPEQYELFQKGEWPKTLQLTNK